MNKITSKRVATIASKILRDRRFSEASKSVAGSSLVQTKKEVLTFKQKKK